MSSRYPQTVVLLPEMAASRSARRPARWSAWLAIAAGLVNLISVAVPAEARRLASLREYVPGAISSRAAVVVAAAGLAMLLLAGGLRRRSRMAWILACLLLLVSSAAHVLKGLDVEEALLDAFLGGMLVASGEHFIAGASVPGRLVELITDLSLAFAATVVVGVVGLFGAADGVSPLRAFTETARMAIAGNTTIDLPRHVRHVLPLSTQVVFLGGLLITVLRALAPHKGKTPSPATPEEAMNADDSLSWFATRGDRVTVRKNGVAVAYGIRGSVMLASGDPLGPPDKWPDAIALFLTEAASQGRVAAVIACSEAGMNAYQQFALRPVYMGDEAILDLDRFSIRGGKMKTVRGSWNRARRAGYTCDLRRVGDLTAEEASALQEVSDDWRGTESERGFSMTLGRLFAEEDSLAIVAVARNDTGDPVGFLHLVPWDHDGVSLDVMRRDRDAISVMNDFLIVEAAQGLPGLGVRRMSLNFAALRSILVAGWEKQAPIGVRLQRRALMVLSRTFQIETLYRFNKKFDPIWVPRYAMVELTEDVPRVLWAALRAEGLISLPAVRRSK